VDQVPSRRFGREFARPQVRLPASICGGPAAPLPRKALRSHPWGRKGGKDSKIRFPPAAPRRAPTFLAWLPSCCVKNPPPLPVCLWHVAARTPGREQPARERAPLRPSFRSVLRLSGLPGLSGRHGQWSPKRKKFGPCVERRCPISKTSPTWLASARTEGFVNQLLPPLTGPIRAVRNSQRSEVPGSNTHRQAPSERRLRPAG